MSLAKAAPDGLNDRECEKMALHERPPIPYVPEKDSVQETVSSYKDNHLMTLIKEGTELRVPIWHSGTSKAFLIHMGSAQEAIKKKGYFKSFEDHSDTYSEKCKKVKEKKDQLVALKEASAAQPKDPKETTVEATNKSSAALCTETKAELLQALEAVAEATTNRYKAAEDMFQLYANLLSVDARYAWDKIAHEQTKANPYMGLQGLTRKGPRGMARKSFEDCVMFHLLTVFPNNAAEQAWLIKLGFVSVGYTPQTTDICVCRRHVDNVGPTRRRHSLKSAFFCRQSRVGKSYPQNTRSYMFVGISTDEVI
jgi:hypothetical protein